MRFAGPPLARPAMSWKRHRVDHRRALADFANGEGNQMTSHWLQVAYVVAPPGVTLTPVAGLVHP